MISPNHLDTPHSAPAKPRRPAFTLTPVLRASRRLRGVSDSTLNCVYHDTEENMSDYRRLNVANCFPEPTTEELVAWLHDAIESFADGLRQAPWEIHCAATLIAKLEGGSK